MQLQNGVVMAGEIHSLLEIQVREEIDDFFDFVSTVTQNAMECGDFDQQLGERLSFINDLADELPVQHRACLMKYCFDLFSTELDQGAFCFHARHKPFGYAGDFRVIDGIYQNKTCVEGRGRLWDEIFLRQPAARAVRNRKDYFLGTFTEYSEGCSQPVMSLACGPCREIREAAEMPAGGGDLFFHCVDIDGRAIQYAQNIMREKCKNSVKVRWERSNALRLRPHTNYGLIWCAGLFDYLDDRISVGLLNKIWLWLSPGGKAVIGNFHPSNPSRSVMEWLFAWPLIHRTERELESLACNAGIPGRSISVDREHLGINVFLILTKDGG